MADVINYYYYDHITIAFIITITTTIIIDITFTITIILFLKHYAPLTEVEQYGLLISLFYVFVNYIIL